MTSKPLVHTFGLRSPESKGIGQWDAAFVYASDGATHTTGLFVDNRDYVGHAGLEQVLKGYDLLKNAGWQPMSTEDLRQTANVNIDSKTNLQPRPSVGMSFVFKLIKWLVDLFWMIVYYILAFFNEWATCRCKNIQNKLASAVQTGKKKCETL